MPDDTNINCIPPKGNQKRNEYGLINDGSVTYVYNDDGTINWRKMIKSEYLVPNKERFQERGIPVPATAEGLPDADVVILLGGLKELAQTRGFSSVRFVPVSPNENYVVTTCSIVWLPNYETRGEEITFSGVGDASPGNTSKLGGKYLGPISENRAFCRAIRNFLKIHIVSQDEIGGPSENSTTQVQDVASGLLKETLKKYNFPFESLRAKMVEEKLDGADKWTCVEDIPRFKQLELLERIKRKMGETA